ncbi:MAG: hypothetical protein C5B48_15600 [Candidatus Rokuibacteriota bacterium]|nr:MAG: hypothetical protein C5B48_15600 [Candidatus Rokubacteria bacterium]
MALATCAEIPEGDEDAPLLDTALAEQGVDARWATWSDPKVDWRLYDLVVLRSTWDYAERYADFLRWLDGLPRILNPKPVVRWSIDKRYLGELELAGAPVVPTQFLEPGESFDPPGCRFVVKPRISAGGRHAAAYEAEEVGSAVEHVRWLHREGRSVVIQPYLETIADHGETGVVYIGGSYSHGFRKGPLLRPGAPPASGLYLEELIEPREPTEAERRAADATLRRLPCSPDDLLYARVDLAPGADREPLVLEVELAEPSLYLGCGKGAADLFAAAISAALRT